MKVFTNAFFFIVIALFQGQNIMAQEKSSKKVKNDNNKITCIMCKGTGSGEGIPLHCMNCISWSAEYKRKVACHECKDTRIVYKDKCNLCKGKGKIDKDFLKTEVGNSNGTQSGNNTSVYIPPITDKPMSDEEAAKLYNANIDPSLQNTSTASQNPVRPKQDGTNNYVEIISKKDNSEVVDKNSNLQITYVDIIEKYLQAIGSKEEIKKIHSVNGTISLEMMGRSFTGIDKISNPNKRVTEIKMGDMIVMRSAFNGSRGYQMQGGTKSKMAEDEVKEALDEKGVIPQMFYTSNEYKMEYIGIGNIGNESTYLLKILMPSGRQTIQEYSTNTGLLLKEQTTSKQGNQNTPLTIEYKNYKKVGGILLPHEITRNADGQEFTIIYTNIELNNGVQPEDFE